ncbi:MAG TPA: methyltransferase domain-containing protein [Xanthobacteraceae bacterium]|jgi:SAM-dependent methyltransferase
MHPDIYAAFDRICLEAGIDGPVLEVGAVPGPEALLCLPALATTPLRLGISLDGPGRTSGAIILGGDANHMSMFGDATFAMVLCNSVLEHDRRFWLTLAEIHRVAKPGALVAIGVPGYAEPPPSRRRVAGRALERAAGPSTRLGRRIGSWLAGTPTLGIHNYPGDYFRFSVQAMTEVLLAGYRQVRVQTIMQPPRIIGWGRRA